MLALQSGLLGELISSVPCCSTTALSLPFNSVVVKNLLAIISCGVSLPLTRDDLLNVKVVADLLDITLGQLEVEKSDVKAAKKARVKKKIPKKEVMASSPKPYLQNDNDHDSDEIVEITPEIFHEEDTGTIPAHFLMQVQYTYRDLWVRNSISLLTDGVPGGLQLRCLPVAVRAGAHRAAA